MNKNLYTDNVNLDNGIEDEFKQIMNDQLSLSEFVNLWLELFKKNSIKTASYARLLESKKVMSNYDISRKKICDITFFDIQRYINELVDSGYSINNINIYVN